MSAFQRYAPALCAIAAMLPACAESSSVGAPGVVPQARADAPARQNHVKSWMVADAKSIKELLYVSGSGYGSGTAYVYNYRTGSLAGMLDTGANEGQCVDKLGDTWFIFHGGDDGQLGSAVEYAHGGTMPVKTLNTEGYSTGCSIDPTSGDLAVTNTSNAVYGPSDIVVFRNASGTPKAYYNTYCGVPSPPGYDRRGNLYVEGFLGQGLPNVVCEIPHNKNRLNPVGANVSLPVPEGVMWDGAHITLASQIGSPAKTAIYQMDEDASGNLVKAGRTILSDVCYGDRALVRQPFIIGDRNTPANSRQGHTIVGGNSTCPYRFDYWTYPRGGNPTKSIYLQPYVNAPTAQSVSIASK